MKSAIPFLAAGLLAAPGSGAQGTCPSLPPIRTPAVPGGERGPQAAPRPPSARLAGRVFAGDLDAPLAGEYTLTLFGAGLRGELELGEHPLALEVEGGTGRFDWSIVAPGFDPAWGVVALREGKTATLGDVRLARGSAVLEGLVSGPSGHPAAGAEVSLSDGIRPWPAKVGEEAGRAKTDERGRFRFDGVAAGTGFVLVRSEELPAMAAVPVGIAPGGRHWIELSPPVGSLLVRVHGKWERPFQLRLDDGELRLATAWTFEPPAWVDDGLDLRSGASVG